MYFNNSNYFDHGLLFHYFHDNNGIHKKCPGSINAEEFRKIINFVGRDNIIDAKAFSENLQNNKLEKNQVCITFDDALKSQIDIALPVLEEFKIKAFFFIYTSIFEKNFSYLEIFRYFRDNYFKNVDDFYNSFYKILNRDLKDFFFKNKNLLSESKKLYPFYSEEDIKFRLVRDTYISNNNYENIMIELMNNTSINIDDLRSKLFFNQNDLISLDKLDHVIGLHSHSHPLKIEKLSYDEQKIEYSKNQSFLAKILKKNNADINSCSYPCGNFNEDSLKILRELNIELAFKDNMKFEKNSINLNLPRLDSSEILKII